MTYCVQLSELINNTTFSLIIAWLGVKVHINFEDNKTKDNANLGKHIKFFFFFLNFTHGSKILLTFFYYRISCFA